MNKQSDSNRNSNDFNRRKFFKVGASAVAAGALGLPMKVAGSMINQETEMPKIKDFRVLGRTGFKVSDISMGGTRVTDSSVVRYAYDHGVNYFDTAEGYGNGNAEKCIGDNMSVMERSKIFITTKLHLNDDESEQSILDRFEKCLQRLNTEYVDCLYMHNPPSVEALNHAGFHAATKKLISEKRLRFIGLSSHGPRSDKDTMESVLTAAAEDGRFDVMLMVYNYLNREAGEKVLAACKKNNVGTTAMKISPRFVKIDPYDPDNPTPAQKRNLDRMMQRGRSKEEAEKSLLDGMKEQEKTLKEYKPLFDKYGVKTEDDLYKATIQWVLQNPDMHTVCMSFSDFDLIDKVIPLSGTKMSNNTIDLLNRYGQMINNQYCRHSCIECKQSCPENLPVSTIMRYAYYYLQGQEKTAMSKYNGLGDLNAMPCHGCDAPCLKACPYKLNVQANLVQAHSMLTLA